MNRVCPGCPTLLPLVTKRTAERITERLRAVGKYDPRSRTSARLDVLDVCLTWLAEPHPLLRMKAGIVGRAYSRAEKDAIALQEHVVEAMPCPFAKMGMCLLGGQGTVEEMLADEAVGPWGWLPALLGSAIDQQSVSALCRRGLVADAKLALLNRRHSFPVRSPGGLAIASTLPEQQQEAGHGTLPGVVSLHPH